MQQHDPLLLLTRPERDAQAFLDAFRSLQGWKVPALIAPVVSIETRVPEGEDVADDVIFTSKNALATAPDITGKRCHVVGEMTARAASEKGATIITRAATAHELVDSLVASGSARRATWLRGADVAFDLKTPLSVAGWHVDQKVTYRQVAKPFDAETKAALEIAGQIVAPVFSPLSARFLSSEWPQTARAPHVIAISSRAAQSWDAAYTSLKVAAHPDRNGMMLVLAEFFPAIRVVAPKTHG